MHVVKPINIYMDHQGAMFMASNVVTNEMSKYFDLLRDYIAKGLFTVEYASTDTDLTDIDIMINVL